MELLLPPTHLIQSLLSSQQLLLERALKPLSLQLLLLLLDQLIPASVLQDPLQLRLAVYTQAPGEVGAIRRHPFPPSQSGQQFTGMPNGHFLLQCLGNTGGGDLTVQRYRERQRATASRITRQVAATTEFQPRPQRPGDMWLLYILPELLEVEMLSWALLKSPGS